MFAKLYDHFPPHNIIYGFDRFLSNIESHIFLFLYAYRGEYLKFACLYNGNFFEKKKKKTRKFTKIVVFSPFCPRQLVKTVFL